MTNQSNQLQTTDLQVLGMTCDACGRHVTNALQQVPGVTEVHVDRHRGSAQVQHAESTSVDALIDAIDDAGYEGFPALKNN